MASRDVTDGPQSHPHGGLKGDPAEPSTAQPKVGGWHFVEWGCELVGTLFQLFCGFGVVALMESPLAPGLHAVRSGAARLLLIGLAFGLLAAIVAVSPLGRRSGAHLNPAVTAGFWARGHTHLHDLGGFAVAQTLGALTAAWLFEAVFGDWARSAGMARTAPQAGLSPWAAAGIEAALTFGLLCVVFAMVSSPRTARLTPVVVTGWLPVLIWLGAPHTGASMNPARTLGPDIVSHAYPAVVVYLVGPLAGALLAAGLSKAWPRWETLTAKMFHDSSYPSTHRSELPAKSAGSHRPAANPPASRRD